MPVFRQTGLMAFRMRAPARYAELEETPLERAESVDMVRFLENGITVPGVVQNVSSLGVDLPEHVGVAEHALREDELQRAAAFTDRHPRRSQRDGLRPIDSSER